MVESAFTVPLMLVLSVSVFEFGRAFHAYQVVSNAAREGARIAVLPNSDDDSVRTRVRGYIATGQLHEFESAGVDIVHDDEITIAPGTTASASTVTVTYPFEFVVLQPVMTLIAPDTEVGESFAMTVASTMRNETP
jgi:Flp pilus assembly protein TadG